MDQRIFFLEDSLKEISNRFIKGGWVDIFRNADEYSAGVFCYLVKEDHLEKQLKTREKGIWKGSEGRPSVGTFNLSDGSVTRYSSFGDPGLEPFLYSKYFPAEKYIDVSEEFVNYFKLYEKGTSKQERTYYFLNDDQEMEEVLVITKDNVRLKLKFLMEYISIRKLHFAICFDFMKIIRGQQPAYEIPFKDEDFISDWYNYNHRVGLSFGTNEFQSWLTGKLVIKYDPTKSSKTWYDLDFTYEDFIIGHDEQSGEEIRVSCDSEQHQFFVPVYFKKQVLSKYYQHPAKYQVDGFSVHGGGVSLKMDNHNDDYVVVFLNDLRILSQREQLHWKHHNIAPNPGMGISLPYYDTMILGNWARKSEATDIRFKEEYRSFNKRWFEKYGWYFYKLPSGADLQLFDGLHLPAEDSIVSFCEQILTVVKFTIDSLNEEMLVKGLPKIENEKGIAKLERFLSLKLKNTENMVGFIRHLQNLRSGLIAHNFSGANKNCKKAMEYFKMDGGNYRKVAEDILIKSIWTLNSLSNNLLTGIGDDDEAII